MLNDNIDQIITMAQMISDKYDIPMAIQSSMRIDECTIRFNRNRDVFEVNITNVTDQDTVLSEIVNHYGLIEKQEDKEIKLDENTVVSIGINDLKQLINSAVNSAIDNRFGV